MKNKICLGMGFVFICFCLGALWSNPALSQNANPGIIPPNASFGGLTYQEWQALYVDQIIAPLYGYPPLQPDFNSKNVHFLPVTNGSEKVLTDTVPAGKTVMLMVLSMLDNDDPILDENGDPVLDDLGNPIPWIDQDFEDWIRFAGSGSFSCSMDGVPVRDLQNYVFMNRLLQAIRVDLGPPYGVVRLNWVVGIELLLNRLTPGSHIIRLYHFIPEYGGYTFDVTYKIEVVPGPPVMNGK